MLKDLEDFHAAGYVHRDVKASNFVQGLQGYESLSDIRGNYYIVDFGLAKRHIDRNGEIVPARETADFRGTSMYASLAAHRLQDLGPKDDMWSMLFVVLDFLRGELPWSLDAQLKNRSAVEKLKSYYTEEEPRALVEGLPGEDALVEIIEYLVSLTYTDKPDYGRIHDLLLQVSQKSQEVHGSDALPVAPDASCDEDVRKLTACKPTVAMSKWNHYADQVCES